MDFTSKLNDKIIASGNRRASNRHLLECRRLARIISAAGYDTDISFRAAAGLVLLDSIRSIAKNQEIVDALGGRDSGEVVCDDREYREAKDVLMMWHSRDIEVM